MLKQTHIYKTDLILSFWICCVTFPQNHDDDPCIPASIHSTARGDSMRTKFPAFRSWYHHLCGTVSNSTMCCDLSNRHSSGTFNRHSNLCLFHSMLAVLVKCCENDKRRLPCGKLMALTWTHKVKQNSPQKNCSPLWDIQSQQHGGTKKCQWLQILMQGAVGQFFLCIHLTCISRQQYKMAKSAI
jgi:hypothetical protein